MGYFSWITSDTKKRIIIGKRTDVYVLIPKEFGGGHIKESCYDGYGRFGGKDIYDLVTEWNREHLSDICKRDDWECDWCVIDKKIALLYYVGGDDAVESYVNQKYPVNHYIRQDWKRNIGICLACYDKDNFRLPYPIKIAESPDAVYEECKPSKSDPMQGCY